MNKILKIIIFTLCTIISTTTYSSAEEYTSTITAEVYPTYTVEIPSSTSIPYKNPDSVECTINFSDIFLDDGYCLKVQLSHDNFKNLNNSSYSIPYTIDCNECLITQTNHTMCFKPHVDKVYLVTYPPGKYTSKVTVTIEYMKL